MQEIYEDLDGFIFACKTEGVNRVFVSIRGDQKGESYIINCAARFGKDKEEVLVYGKVEAADRFDALKADTYNALKANLKGIMIVNGTLAVAPPAK